MFDEIRPLPRDPETILRETFGYEAFRPSQREVIDHVVGGGSALLIMPTGGGKSLCFQVPALAREGTGIVVSPLIALMQDQVDALRELGVRAAFLNSAQELDEQRDVLRRLHAGQLDLLYVAPERAVTERFLDAVEGIRVSLLAIDEAHCISQWGHEFRPEYRQLSSLRERWPDVPCLAATATADAATRADVAEQLGLATGDVFVTGFDRPNLFYQVVPKVDARKQLVSFLNANHRDHAGIVYCGTRKRCELVAGWLRDAGFDAAPYHAGMEPGHRAEVQRRFLREPDLIVCATIAFGMGIDKPDVRFVAHLDCPKSLEAYYQESGRAGRDGDPAHCWMAFGWQDVVRVGQMIGEASGSPHRQVERRKLEQLIGWAETASCRRAALLRYFGSTSEVTERCDACDNCQNPPEVWDATTEAQKFLSCVFRTGQRFGVVHVIEVLLGNDTDKIRRFGHDRLSTYGIGKELDAKQWRSIARQLAAIGLIAIDIDAYGALTLTETSREVLSGGRTVELKRDRAADTRGARLRKSPAAPEDEGDYDVGLFDKLRALRQQIASEQDVPAYVIFHDRTLREMARQRPGSIAQLGELHGVGATKLERYGERFLQELQG